MDAINHVGNGTPAPISFANAQRAARAYGVKGAVATPQAKMPSAAQRLVAAVVPGSVDFSGDVPAVAQGAIAFYRNPADRNAAALAVNVGRSLDATA
jgi:hypothetical protein